MTTTSSRCRPLSPSKERAQFWKPYPAYKPSGVEWLGDLPEHWEVKRGRFAMSVNPPAPRLRALKPEDEVSFVPMEAVGVGGGITLGQTRVISEVSSGYTEFQDGDVVVAKITPCFENGKAALARGLLNGAAYGTTELHVLRAGQMMDRSFLFYVAISDTFRKLGESEMYGAGGQKRVPPEFNRNFRLPLPPSIEQRAIAMFLDRETGRVDRLVAKKRELIERLKEKRTALISRTVTRGLPPAAARAAGLPENPPLKPSGLDWLGDIPAHWEVKRLKFTLKERLQYGANESSEIDDTDLPRYVRITDIDERGRLRPETFRSLPVEIAQDYFLEAGDMLFARSGATSGKTFLYRLEWGMCAYAGYLIRARLDQRKIVPQFLHHFTDSSHYWQWLSSSLIQATIHNVSAEKYADLALPLPPLPEQAAIAAYLDRETAKLDALVGKVEEAVERLQEYRTALITAAVTGKIDVRNEASAGMSKAVEGRAAGYSVPQPELPMAAEGQGKYRA